MRGFSGARGAKGAFETVYVGRAGIGVPVVGPAIVGVVAVAVGFTAEDWNCNVEGFDVGD